MNDGDDPSEVNLDAFEEATAGMTPEQRARFEAMFLGALSNHVEPDLWARCLQTASQVVERHFVVGEA